MEEQPVFFIIAGEASGDLLGARLMRALSQLTEGKARFVGVGGPRMREEGIELFFAQEELAHFGLFELLRHVPHLLKRMRETVTEVKRVKPSALITIDAPDFCFRVARKLKGAGIPLIHYVAPTVWAWRAKRAKRIAEFLDHLLVLLPFEPPYFLREGLAATFAGHPIVESEAGLGDAVQFRLRHDLHPDDPLLCLLPGSRMSEVTRMMPIFRETVTRLRHQLPRLSFVLPTTPGVAAFVRKEVAAWKEPVTLLEGDREKYDAMAASTAALACSGTVSIELAMAKLPAVIAYKISSLTYFLYRHLVTVKYANLVNIMHKRMVTPEFLQKHCTPKKLAAALYPLLTDDRARYRQIDGLEDVAHWLGAGKFIPSERAAAAILNVIDPLRQPLAEKTYTVLQVLPALFTGGVERGTIEMVAALVKDGKRAIVASAGGPMAREVEEAGGVHLRLPMGSKNPLTMRANVTKLMGVIRDYKIDIVHARSRAPAWSARAAAAKTKTPFVTTFHNAYNAKTFIKRGYNGVMAKGARVIAISHFVADHAATVYGIGKDRLRVIPRGVDVERFNPQKVDSMRIELLRREWKLAKDRPILMLPGRLTRWKGQLVLMEALRLLGRRDLQTVIVGGGPASFRREIEKTVTKLGLDGVVRLTDTCRDMPAAYMLADIVVAPSTRPEGFGRVIIEAQAMGRPVIGTSHGGARETIIPGETGWLTPPGDAMALADAIAEILSLSQDELLALGQRAITHIWQHYTVEMMTQRTLAVYDEVMHIKEP